MEDSDRTREAAEFLYQAHRERRQHESLPDDISPRTLEEAYAAQEAFQELLAGERGDIAGYKIALTTPVMQRMVGHDALLRRGLPTRSPFFTRPGRRLRLRPSGCGVRSRGPAGL